METFRKNLEFGPSLVCVLTMGISGWKSRRGRMGGAAAAGRPPPATHWGVGGLHSLVGGDSHHNGKSHLGVVT